MANYEQHRFFCLQCGQETLPILRKVNHKHGKHHLKKLWCPHCKITINCVECRNDQEISEFKEKWLAGEYAEALESSLAEISKEEKVWS